MKDTLRRLQKQGQEVHLYIRDKEIEGVIQNMENGVVNLVGDKYEYFIPVDHVLFVGLKLDTERRRRNKSVGFNPIP